VVVNQAPPHATLIIITGILAVAAAAVSLTAGLVDAQPPGSNAQKAPAVLKMVLRKHLVHADLRGDEQATKHEYVA
jgi:hypothetical protein